MKTFIKSIILLSMILTIVIVSCKKADTVAPANPAAASTSENYSSITDFFTRNQVASVSHNVDATSGGTFTTTQGTVVTVPSSTFVNASGGAVTGPVVIEFKDIYKKSDMFFSNVSTTLTTGQPMKSGGNFFIKATAAGVPVTLAPGSHITVTQPASLTGGMDMGMANLTGVVDASSIVNWTTATTDSIGIGGGSYTTNVNTLTYTGSWCNSDNCGFFSAYPETLLNIHQTDSRADYNTVLYLIFPTVNSCIHVYYGGSDNFPYNYAPVGLQCTVVAVGTKDGHAYSSFTPITIAAGMTINYTMTETTTAAIQAQLNALN